jgi:hypothetical protein
MYDAYSQGEFFAPRVGQTSARQAATLVNDALSLAARPQVADGVDLWRARSSTASGDDEPAVLVEERAEVVHLVAFDVVEALDDLHSLGEVGALDLGRV